MTWFKVDDSFHAHPKVLATEPAALGLWVIAGAWSSAHLTDGVVPDHALSRLLPDSATLAQKLVTAGLWRRIKGGYRFHDWSDFNPSSADVRELREKRAAAGRIGGRNSGRNRSKTEAKQVLHSSRDSVGTDTHRSDQGLSRSKPGSKTEALASPIVEPPTRPDPLKNNTSSSTATPSTDRPSKPGSDDDPLFVRFWAAYPRRIGKGQARKAWAAAVKKTDPEGIIAAASRFTSQRGHEDPKFTPHPSTWLNGERWNDSPDPAPTATPGPVMPWELWD